MLSRSCRSLQLQYTHPIRIRCISPWRSQYARRYATASANDEPTNTYGSITTRSPLTTSIEELLTELKNASRSTQIVDKATGPSLLALFLTPTYAQHALDPELPLRALEHLNGSSKSARDVKSVVAVVDRLPGDAIPGTRLTRGAEGLAYTLKRCLSEQEEEILSDRTLLDSSTLSSKQLSQPKPGTLSFRLSANPDLRYCDADISMPLAQTTFSTGLVSTMVSATYRPDPKQDNVLTAESSPAVLEFQRIPLTFKTHSKEVCGTNMTIPLKPLTRLRRVEHCMGNIIRSLSSQPSSVFDKLGEASSSQGNPAATEAQPASSELESAIQSFFDLNKLAPQPVQVWALILPADIDKSRPHFREYPKLFEPFFNAKEQGEERIREFWATNIVMKQLVMRFGARLCRVLSGGGGWGKKAGLLSLDPENSYGGESTQQSRASDRAPTFGSIEDLEEQKMSALGDIVKEGEHVMFLLGPPSPDHEFSSEGQTISSLPWSSEEHIAPLPLRSLIFGCLPSSVDDVPQSATTADRVNDTQRENIVHHQNRFGVLSEGGLAFASTPIENTNSTRPNQSKVDVPFARISLQPSALSPKPKLDDKQLEHEGEGANGSYIFRRVQTRGDQKSARRGIGRLNGAKNKGSVLRSKGGSHDEMELQEYLRRTSKTFDLKDFANRRP